MPIEKQEIDRVEKLPAIYDKSIKVMTDGGLSLDEAYSMVESAHEKFHQKVEPQIIARAIVQAIRDMPRDGSQLNDEDIQKIASRISFEIQRQFVSDPKKEEKTIYRGPGGIELKENSNN
jgi:Glu-tRNA(Gln) amidotransferase subunit E-like FAD-binding protein